MDPSFYIAAGRLTPDNIAAAWEGGVESSSFQVNLMQCMFHYGPKFCGSDYCNKCTEIS